MKLNKWKLIVSSVLILLPMVFGLAVFELLPAEMAIHFGYDGVADNYTTPIVAVVILPLIFLTFHLLCFWITAKFYRGHALEKKVAELLYWMMPTACIIVMASIYALAFDLPVRISMFFYLLFALLFIFIGNYLPKCRRNQMMGVKIKWTLANEENWNMTHRFTGKVWFWCGIGCLPLVFLPDRFFLYPMIVILLITAVLPTVYSYLYYKKQVKEGTYVDDGFISKPSKTSIIILCLILGVILVAVAIIMFTGSIKYRVDDSAVTVEATYHEDMVIKFSDIEKIELTKNIGAAKRVFGFGSPTLSLGTFESELLGKFTCYCYTDCTSFVVLSVSGKTVVLGMSDEAETEALYREICNGME